MPTYRADIAAANDNITRSRWRWISIILLVIILLAVFGYFRAKTYLFEGLPSLPDKQAMWEMNLKPNTTLLDRNGDIIGHRGPFVGRPMKLKEMPDYLPEAFLAIEDERFYEHSGVDRKAILRALFENTKSGETVQGGSTLTQQLVKNMLLTRDKNYRRKFQEAWLAYEMEQVLSKPEILELYLNRIDLGNRSFGVEAAAQRYFGKSAADVTMSEAAMLAALPKAPSRYDPSRNFEGAWDRGKIVLQRMLTNNFISLTEMSQAETNPPIVVDNAQNLVEPAQIGHVFDMISERAEGLVGHKSNDLIIQTTLDPKFQSEAHASLVKILERSGESRKISDGALVTIDNSKGAVLALVGGRDYQDSKFNRAAQAKRQPGSSFKAFVYAAALETGFTPGTVRIDQPTSIGKWQPENYTKRYRGPMTIREALKHSINTIAAQVGAEVGPKNIADIGKRFGLKTPLRAHYSIALGSSEVTLLDMTSAYAVFPNKGLRRNNYIIESISNTAGDTLYTRQASKPERVYSERYANQMVGMLQDVVASGTGHGARMGSREIGGKTGTSQDYRDAWFFGFSQQYTTGVWLGNDDNSSMAKVTGGLHPVDVWKNYMTKIHKNIKKLPLILPSEAINDQKVKDIQIFYSELETALLEERNLAAGIQTVDQSNGQSTGGGR